VGQDKKEESVQIDGIDDIYQYADRLIEIAKAYEV
jgi:hypothetical protein